MVSGLRIGELSEQSGLSRDTIRHYEKKGLITSTRDATRNNTYRKYSADALHTLKLVRDAQEAGFSIDELSTLLKIVDGATSTSQNANFLDMKISDLELRIDRCTSFLGALQEIKEIVEIS